ncbi:MAG: hypothetical protein R8P61_32305 [Bacteroidia bacterium]|nr:hypothetical protein [Bacteroidia bacterium]
MKNLIEIKGMHVEDFFDVQLYLDPSLSLFAQITYLEIIKQVICKQQISLTKKAKSDCLSQLQVSEDRSQEILAGFHASDNSHTPYPFSLDDLPF